MTANCVFLSVHNWVRSISYFSCKRLMEIHALSHSWKQCHWYFILFKSIYGYKEGQKIQYWDALHTVILDKCKLTSAKQQRRSAGLATCKVKTFCLSTEYRYRSTSNQYQPRHRIEVSGLLHDPAVLPPGRNPRTNWTEGYLAHRTCMDLLEKINNPRPCRESRPWFSSP